MKRKCIHQHSIIIIKTNGTYRKIYSCIFDSKRVLSASSWSIDQRARYVFCENKFLLRSSVDHFEHSNNRSRSGKRKCSRCQRLYYFVVLFFPDLSRDLANETAKRARQRYFIDETFLIFHDQKKVWNFKVKRVKMRWDTRQAIAIEKWTGCEPVFVCISCLMENYGWNNNRNNNSAESDRSDLIKNK